MFWFSILHIDVSSSVFVTMYHWVIRHVSSILLKSAANIYNTFKPLYIILSIFGLFPYSIKYDKTQGHFRVIPKSLYVNLLCATCVILTILCFLTLHMFHIIANSESSSYTDTIVTQLNYILELLNLVLSCIVCYIYTYINRNKYVKILNLISTTWDQLKNNIKSNNMLQKLRLQVYVNVLGGLFLLLLLHLCINFTRDDSLWKIILVTFSFDLPQFIQFIYLSHFYLMMQMVIVLLKIIRLKIPMIVNDKSNYINGFVDPETSIVKLRHLEMAYTKAFELANYVNVSFRTPILFTTVASFHSMVSEAHILYHGIAIDRSLSAHDIINCSIWISWQLIKVYILADTGNRLKYEVRNSISINIIFTNFITPDI